MLPRVAASFVVALVGGAGWSSTLRALVSRSGGFAGLRWAPVEAAMTGAAGRRPCWRCWSGSTGKTEKQRKRGGLHRRKAMGGGQLPLG